MKPKEGTPNKAKIKSAGRMLKNAGFNVLGTLTKEEASSFVSVPNTLKPAFFSIRPADLIFALFGVPSLGFIIEISFRFYFPRL